MNPSILRVGFRSGLIACIATLAFYVVQTLQIIGLLLYPWDEILIYGFSFCITIPFLMEMLALHYSVDIQKKYWSHLALLCTAIYVVFVSANYIVQLATVIPYTLQGKGAEIELLRQTPHSMFWDFDAAGYIFMGLATLFSIPLFENKGFQKWVKYSLVAHSAVTPLICFVYFHPVFNNHLLLLATPWAITAPLFMLLIAIDFKKNRTRQNSLKS